MGACLCIRHTSIIEPCLLKNTVRLWQYESCFTWHPASFTPDVSNKAANDKSAWVTVVIMMKKSGYFVVFLGISLFPLCLSARVSVWCTGNEEVWITLVTLQPPRHHVLPDPLCSDWRAFVKIDSECWPVYVFFSADQSAYRDQRHDHHVDTNVQDRIIPIEMLCK